MIITTKTGDLGQTNLYGARRVPKHHSLIEINGQLDSLQAVIGLLKTKIKKKQILAELEAIQKFLYQTMAYVANAKALTKPELSAKTAELETWQSYWLSKSSINNRFVIPGQKETEALAHYCRTHTRELERRLCKSMKQQENLKKLIPYFNRLSDYFFVLSQFLLK